MFRPGRVLAGWLAALLAVGLFLSSCSSDPSAKGRTPRGGQGSADPNRIIPPTIPTPSGLQLPKCDFPAKVRTPGWVPDDLPLPEGTYASQSLPASYGYQRAIFVVPGDLLTLARFVLKDWPEAGWVLGRGESERGEIEDQFSKPPAVGAFKAQQMYCSPGYSLMLLIYAADSSDLTNQPGTQGGSPIPASPSTG